MAAPLTPAQREEYARQAWRLSLKGNSAPQIAGTLGISEKTVDALLKRERQRVAKQYDRDRLTALAHFEGEQDAIIADAWTRLDQISPEARTAPDLQGNILTASMNKAKMRGLLIEKQEMSGSLAVDVTTTVRDLMAAPIEVTYADPEPQSGP